MFEIRTDLTQTLQQAQIYLPPGQIDRLACHWELVEEANSHFNLTAIKAEEAAAKHYADCLLALPAVAALQPEEGSRVLDIGSGAGFPGLVLAIACPQLHFSLLEATAKKADFLRRCVNELALPNVEVICSRAEELGRSEQRGSFRLVTARAVAGLPVLVEYALPLLELSGSLLALKGPGAAEELLAAKKAIFLLGGRAADTYTATLPGGGGERTILRVDKISPTPAKYPRRSGVPAKNPL